MAPDPIPLYEPLMSGTELHQIREGLGFLQDAFARHLGFAHGGIIRAYERGYIMRRQRRCPFIRDDEGAERRFQERQQKRAHVVQLLDYLHAS